MKKCYALLLFVVIAPLAFIAYAVSPNRIDVAAFAPIGIPHGARETLPGTVRIVSYNMGYASDDKNNQGAILTRDEVIKHLDAMAARLRTHRPDIVVLQEVDFDAHRSHGINELAYLADHLDLPYHTLAITWNLRYLPWPYWPIRAHFGRMVSGQAILSRFPMLHATTHRFAKPTSNPVWYNWFYLDRVAQEVQLEVDGQRIDLWNVHLEAFDATARRQQTEQLAALMSPHRNTPVIVAGDFNSEPKTGSSVTQFLHTTGLTATDPLGEHPTLKDSSEKTIDYILHSTHWSTQSFFPLATSGSDHWPIAAELTLY